MDLLLADGYLEAQIEFDPRIANDDEGVRKMASIINYAFADVFLSSPLPP